MTLRKTKSLSLLLLLMTSILTFSCKENKSNSETVDTEQKEETTSQDTNIDKTVDKDALNPIHGEPGHRCDIPVGAPLNSKSANQKQNQIQVNGNPVQQSRNSENINPPHGEPGHQCGKPVGAPLDN